MKQLLLDILNEWVDCWCNSRIGYGCPACDVRKRIKDELDGSNKTADQSDPQGHQQLRLPVPSGEDAQKA